jgi:DNA repair protein RadC
MKTKTFTFYIKEPPLSKASISSTTFAAEELRPIVQSDQESFWVFGLNRKHRVIYQDCLFIGGMDNCPVDIRILFRRLLTVGASAFIIVHNHPGGDSLPSKEDKQITRNVEGAANILGLKFLDHIVISDDGYTSFKDLFLLT